MLCKWGGKINEKKPIICKLEEGCRLSLVGIALNIGFDWPEEIEGTLTCTHPVLTFFSFHQLTSIGSLYHSIGRPFSRRNIWGANYQWNVALAILIFVYSMFVGVITGSQKWKMNAKSFPVWLEWLVNCFLEAPGGILYFGHLKHILLARNNIKVMKWHTVTKVW